MRRPFVPSLRTARRAAVLVLPVALLVPACDHAQDTVAPGYALAGAPQASLGSLPGQTNDIMDLVSDLTAAWTAKDAAAYAAPYASDVHVVNPVGGLIDGREAFQAQHAFLFSGPFAGSTQTIAVRDIRFLTGTIALVLQDVTLTDYAFLPPGLPSTNGVVRTRVTWVVVKRGGKWEIVLQQMTPQLS
jgi:uncharacterized protein (TIGR02246 family)